MNALEPHIGLVRMCDLKLAKVRQHHGPNIIADAALVITVGLVCAQRLEIALRATRMLTDARAQSAQV